MENKVKDANADNVAFYEDLKGAMEEIESMSQEERNAVLYQIMEEEAIKKEKGVNPSWMDMVLKFCIIKDERRRHFIQLIKSGEIYEEGISLT